jgi:hypothetical protein
MPTLAVKVALCLLHALVALDMRLGGLQSQSGHDAEENMLPCHEPKLRHPTQSVKLLTTIINIKHYF